MGERGTMRTYRLKFLTTVQASAEELWEHFSQSELAAADAKGNTANMPAAELTCASRMRRLARSLRLLNGRLPSAQDPASVVHCAPGRGYTERARLTAQRSYKHECWILSGEGRCIVADEILFEPRYPLAGPLGYYLLQWAFWKRQRNLQRQFARA
jgi:hypothetical protein